MKTRILKWFLRFALTLVICFFPEKWQIWKDLKNPGFRNTAFCAAPEV